MAKTCFMFVLTLLVLFTMKIGNAGAVLVHGHIHGDYRGHDYGGYGYYQHHYHRPQVIINVPPIPFYGPRCHEVEVCNVYGDCWLEDSCY